VLYPYANGDGNLTLSSCCNHPQGGRATVYFSPQVPQTVFAGEDSISVDLILKLGPTTNRTAGIMLLTGAGLLPGNDGWIIRKDPNRNTTPYNYNEKSTIPESIVFNWLLRAPQTTGSKTLRAKLMYGDAGAKSKEATPITITVLPLSIEEANLKNSLGMRIAGSNIITNQLVLELYSPALNGEGELEIFNCSGNLVFKQSFSEIKKRQVRLNIEHWSPGVYFIIARSAYQKLKTLIIKI
jgi:hypothetical protein